MIKNQDENLLYDAFNNAISITNNNAPKFDEILISIRLDNSPVERFSICQNIVNTAKEYSYTLLHLNIGSVKGDTTSWNGADEWKGDKYCSDANCIRTKSLNDTYNLCQDNCKDKDNCRINIIWSLN